MEELGVWGQTTTHNQLLNYPYVTKANGSTLKFSSLGGMKVTPALGPSHSHLQVKVLAEVMRGTL